MAAEAASFRTEMLSMSAGLRKSMPPVGMPSTTHRGSALLSEPVPRIRIDWVDPGCPEFWVTWTPAARPCRACSVLSTGTEVASLTSMVPTAPEILLLCWLP